MKASLLFLGCGGSVGVPIIGCRCETCQSKDPKNKRLRPSVLLRMSQGDFLIDAAPDFRYQALRAGITHLDGLLLTHAHHDHTAGLDDLRPLTYQRTPPLPVLLSAKTAEDIKIRYYYLFPSSTDKENSLPHFDLQLLPEKDSGSILFESILIHYVTYTQGGMSVNGFRIGNLAYLSDIRHFSPTIFSDLKDVKYLVISALRYTHSFLHFSVDEAIDFARRLGAEKVWLTHLSHDLEYTQTNAYLPSGISLAYDGLVIDFDEEG